MTGHDWDDSAPTPGERAAPTPRALFVVVRVADGAVVGASARGYADAIQDARVSGIDMQGMIDARRALFPHSEWDNYEAAGYRLARRAVAL